MGIFWATGRCVFRTLRSLVTFAKIFVWIISGLALLRFVIDNVKEYSTGYVWMPWGMAMGRRVLSSFLRRLTNYFWTAWGMAMRKCAMHSFMKRLTNHVWISWAFAKGRSALELLGIATDIWLWILVVLIMVIQRCLKSVKSNLKTTPGAGSLPSTPDLAQPLGTNDTSSDASDLSSLEALYSDTDGQPRTREQYVQALVDQGPTEVLYADGLLNDETDSGSDPEFMSAPPSSPV